MDRFDKGTHVNNKLISYMKFFYLKVCLFCCIEFSEILNDIKSVFLMPNSSNNEVLFRLLMAHLKAEVTPFGQRESCIWLKCRNDVKPTL